MVGCHKTVIKYILATQATTTLVGRPVNIRCPPTPEQISRGWTTGRGGQGRDETRWGEQGGDGVGNGPKRGAGLEAVSPTESKLPSWSWSACMGQYGLMPVIELLQIPIAAAVPLPKEISRSQNSPKRSHTAGSTASLCGKLDRIGLPHYLFSWLAGTSCSFDIFIYR